MPAAIEQRIHLVLVADPTQHHLLVRLLKHHRPLAVALPFLEAPRVYVPVCGVHHPPLPVGLVVGPFPCVGVAVGVVHCALTGFFARGEVAGVGVAGEGDEDAGAVEAAVGEGDGGVGVGEVAGCEG